MFLRRLRPLLALGLGAVVVAAPAQDFVSEKASFRVVTVARGLEHPWGLAFLSGGEMLVTERPGRMRLVSRDGTLRAPLKGVPAVVAQGQGGLLDVMLDRDFAANRVIHFCFAEAGEGGSGTALARARLGDDGLTEMRVTFRQLPKASGGLHFGCRIVHARDGHIYMALGERYQRDRAQDLSTHLGKIVRLRPDGSVPPDNPFVGKPGVRPEIFSYGHRNPQGMTLHPETGALWMHEHGARGGDEINLPQAGRNYGWPVITHGVDYSGLAIGVGRAAPGLEQPAHFWAPSIAPSGMAFYSGDAIPAWKGSLFVGALAGRQLARLEFDGTVLRREERILQNFGERLRDVRSSPDGFLYLLTDNSDGRILRLEPR